MTPFFIGVFSFAGGGRKARRPFRSSLKAVELGYKMMSARAARIVGEISDT